MTLAILIGIGILAGVLGGMFGIGGAVVIIPLLVAILKFPQTMAQGTTLAMMLPPIGVVAVITYYRQGAVDFKAALFLALGFLFGSYFGARIALAIPKDMLVKLFGTFLIIMGIKMFFK